MTTNQKILAAMLSLAINGVFLVLVDDALRHRPEPVAVQYNQDGQPHAVERGRQCPRAVMLHDRLVCVPKRDLVRS